MEKITHALNILRENSQAFEFSQEYGMEGFLLIEDRPNGLFYLNPKLLSVLGFQKSMQADLSRIFSKKQIPLIRTELLSEESTEMIRSNGQVITAHFKSMKLKKENLILAAVRKVSDPKKEKSVQRLRRYATILQGTDVGAWQWNIQTGEVIFDESWPRILGYELEELEPINEDIWKRLAHPDDLEPCEDLMQQHFDGKTDYYISEARMKHKNGEWVWVKDKGKIVSWTPDGKPEWMAGFHEEITEIRERLHLKKLFIEQAPCANAMFDRDMNYLSASKKWLEDYHLGDTDIIGKCHYDIFPNLREDWKQIHKECLEGASRHMEEDMFINPEGEEQWISWEIRPWYTHDNIVGGIVMSTVDITRIKQAERDSFQKQHMMESVFENIDVGLVACDRHGNLTLFNKATRDWHGLPASKIPQEELSNYYGLYSADGKRPLSQDEIPLLKALKNGTIENEEIMIKPHGKEPIIVSVNGTQLFTNDGEVDGAVVAMHNISKRVLAENKLRISEATFRGGFENSAIGMALLTPTGKWMNVNKRLCEIVGYSAEEMKSISFQDITHPEDLGTDVKILKELISGEREFYHADKRYFHKNGQIVYVNIAASMIRNDAGEPLYFVSQISDITKEKIAEQKLRKTLAEMEGLFEASTQVSIIVMDTNGVITTFNKGAENMLGYCREEVINQMNPLSFHPRKELQQTSEELFKKTGKKLEGVEVLKFLAENKNHDTREWTYIRKDGSSLPIQLTITKIEEEGEVVGYLKVATNISQLKSVENELSEILELTQDQNDRLRNFAHIVSHNLRSHSSNFGMLLDIYTGDHPEQKEDEIIQMLYKASNNLTETIEHLNEVTLIHTSVAENLRPVKISKTINKILGSVNAVIQETGISVENNVPEDLEVLGVQAYLDSILLNFTTNGIKYLDLDKKSFLKFSSEELEDHILLKIEDNGLGIDLKRHGDKLFGMYKTFHKHKDSRGIGLFITKNQIEAMGGSIVVKSETKIGTEFIIKLKKPYES